ncbi:MAG: response regulator [Alphaproteobacteria bacterium]
MLEARERSNILIVDRSTSFGRLLRSELLRSGFNHIRLAGDTEEALHMLANDRFRAVLCDAEAGPLKAAEFVLAARSRFDMADPYVAIIMTSFSASLRKVVACRDAGANTFLAKPVSTGQLTEKLRVSLNENRRFVRVASYFGPERRKGFRMPYLGSERRAMRLVENQIIWSPREAA